MMTPFFLRTTIIRLPQNLFCSSTVLWVTFRHKFSLKWVLLKCHNNFTLFKTELKVNCILVRPVNFIRLQSLGLNHTQTIGPTLRLSDVYFTKHFQNIYRYIFKFQKVDMFLGHVKIQT